MVRYGVGDGGDGVTADFFYYKTLYANFAETPSPPSPFHFTTKNYIFMYYIFPNTFRRVYRI